MALGVGVKGCRREALIFLAGGGKGEIALLGKEENWWNGSMVNFPQNRMRGGDLETILEWEEIWILESEPMINQIPDVPMDDYLQKELERQREEELAGTGDDRIP